MSLRKFKRNLQKKGAELEPAALEKLLTAAIARADHGDSKGAESCFRRILKNDPNHVKTWHHLANLLHNRDEFAKACDCYRKCCELLPFTASCYFNYGTGLHEAERSLEALEPLKKAIALKADYVEAITALGIVQRHTGNSVAALETLDKALQLRPDCSESLRTVGLAQKDLGNMDGALAAFRQAARLPPDEALAWYLLSRYKTFTENSDPDITAIKSMLDRSRKNHDLMLLHFALGKIFDDLHQYSEAFRHYRNANALKRESLGFSWLSSGIDTSRYKKTFTPSFFRRFSQVHGPSSSMDAEPVYIVGMPRSGTTLVEQICTSHSRVKGRGELKLIAHLIRDLPARCQGGRGRYPEFLQNIRPSCLISCGTEIQDRLLAGTPPDTLRVTDKMPANFRELGLIHALFPQARIIHCVRNPIDTCLSNYFQNFDEGNESSYDLESIGNYYRDYQELMKYWESLFPENIYRIHYERLIDNTEDETRKLLEFLDLEWEIGCLDFYMTRRSVQTSSDYQVRQPIYRKSVARWKNYEPFIGGLIETLKRRDAKQ